MNPGGAAMSLTYIASENVIPGYGGGMSIGKGGERTFIELCIDYSRENAPLGKDLYAEDVGSSALFLCSDLARSVTGVTLYVDNGLHAMGMAVDSSALAGGLPVPKADA